MKRLIDEGLLTANGNTRARRYERKPIRADQQIYELSKNSAEDMIWRFKVLPLLAGQKKNVIEVCQHGFTEIFNNCIDHSTSETAHVFIMLFYDEIRIGIRDYGVGIFEKIRNAFGLLDHRHALLELAKGKLTSDRKNHSGEGIFFTSRMFNRFSIDSGHLYYAREMGMGDEWLIEADDTMALTTGTAVSMSIATDAGWTTREVFERFQESGQISFRTTHVPIKLARYPSEQLVSRSQAKRVIARFGDFSEVILDFIGIEEIGQAFADEIFRVFASAHPETRLISIRTSPAVGRMIDYVKNAPPPSGDDLPLFSGGPFFP